MERYHPLKELAPRDVVSRSIVIECRATGEPNVFLDLTHLQPALSASGFRGSTKPACTYGVDLEKHPRSRSPRRALCDGRHQNGSRRPGVTFQALRGR